MRRLREMLFAPHPRDARIAEEVKRANTALEQLQREAADARRDRERAAGRLDRAMTESVKIAKEQINRG